MNPQTATVPRQKDPTRARRVFWVFSLLVRRKVLEDLYVACCGGIGEFLIHDKTS